MNSISLKQLAPSIGISVDEIKEICEFLGNPVRQEGDRTVVPDFKVNGETVSAPAFFRILIQAAPVKDGKPDILQSAIAFKEQLKKTVNKKAGSNPSQDRGSYQDLEPSQRLEFNRYVSQRTNVPLDRVESLDPTSLEGLYVAFMGQTVEVASQIHRSSMEFLSAQVVDRWKYGMPKDAKLLSQAEQDALGKYTEGERGADSPMKPMQLVLEGAQQVFSNFLNFQAPMTSSDYASRQLGPSQTTQTLPQSK